MAALDQIDVVVLCGGEGKRLRSQIGESQKTMATLHAEPFLNVLLRYIKQQGFRRVIFETGMDIQSAGRVQLVHTVNHAFGFAGGAAIKVDGKNKHQKNEKKAFCDFHQSSI